MDIAMRLLKMPPVQYMGDPELDENPSNPDFTMLRDFTPLWVSENIQVDSPFWESEDGNARGTATPNHENGHWELNHFEIKDELQGLGQAESYVEEFINNLREIENTDDFQNTKSEWYDNFSDDPYEMHGIMVEPTAMGFWEKMIDRGLLDAAHETAWVRQNPEGTHYYTHPFDRTKMRPTKPLEYPLAKASYYDIQEQLNALPRGLKDSDEKRRLQAILRSTPDHPVENLSIGSPANAGAKECTITDCATGEPPVLSTRWATPTYSQDYTHHMCYQCADDYDLGHHVRDELKPAVSEDPDVKLVGVSMVISDLLRKDVSYTNIDEGHLENIIKPLHQSLNAGTEPFQYVNPNNLKLSNRDMEGYDKINQRLVQTTWTPTEGIDSKDFTIPRMAHSKLEHIMRTNPNFLNEVNTGDRLSLQVAVDPTRWESPHADEIYGEAGRNEYTKRPVDFHVVYEKQKDGRYRYLTVQPTPVFAPEKRTKFITAADKNHHSFNHHADKGVVSDEKLNKYQEDMINYMKEHNKMHKFDENPHVPDNTYDNLSFIPNEVEERKSNEYTNIIPDIGRTTKHYMTKKGQLQARGKLHKKKWGINQPHPDVTKPDNSLAARLESANNFPDNDKIHAYFALIQLLQDHDINYNDWTVNNLVNKYANKDIWDEAIKKWETIATGYELKQLKEDISVLRKMIKKERKTPEAMRHKREYDTKYESSPERVKYREDLNRERQKRGMYGDHSHRDISHTAGGKLTVESEHDNRARHFKDKGTLRPLTKSMRDDLNLLRNLMAGPMDEQDKKIATALVSSLEERETDEVPEEDLLQHPFFGTTV